MTFALLTPEEQQAVWFLGSLVHIRLGGSQTDGQLAVVHHEGERGFGSPRHRHLLADETFLVLEGELSVEFDGDFQSAGPGSAVFLPRQRSHAWRSRGPPAAPHP
jgi:quercetin dioxygenase-like cupin family protein